MKEVQPRWKMSNGVAINEMSWSKSNQDEKSKSKLKLTKPRHKSQTNLEQV